MNDFPLPQQGSVAFLGPIESMIGPVARSIAAAHILGEGSVCFIEHDKQDGKAHVNALTDLLRGMDDSADIVRLTTKGLRTRFGFVSGADLAPKIETLNFSQRLMLIRDYSRDTLPLGANAGWWQQALELARTFKCVVLSLGHTGPYIPSIQPDYSQYQADALWAFKAGNNLQVTVEQIFPFKRTLRLKGKTLHGGQIGFSNVEDTHAK